MSKEIIKGKTFTVPFSTEEDLLIPNPSIGSLQADFPLCEADYLRIKYGNSKILMASLSIFLTTTGIGLLLIGKLISKQLGYQADISIGEYIALGVGFTISLFLFLFDHFCITNEKNEVMNKIDLFFKNSPRTRHLMKANDD